MIMFSILHPLYQWNVDEVVIIDGMEDTSDYAVHFSVNGDSKVAIERFPYTDADGRTVCDIPNTLLSSGAGILYVYAYNIKERRMYTESARVFPVKRREKPEGYVYQEDDGFIALDAVRRTAEAAVKTVNGMAPDEDGNVDVGGGGATTPGTDGGFYTPSVTQDNPGTMTVSQTPSKDNMPHVPAVTVALPAGMPGNDGASAYEYAVLGGYEGTETEFAQKLAKEVPDAYTLPRATETELGGVKAIAKTEAMTQAVGVDEKGSLFVEPGAGSGGLTSTEKTSILTLLKNAAYTTDVSETVTTLRNLWGDTDGGDAGGGGEDSGGETPTQTYTVTYNLTNVTCDSTATTVAQGGSYTANLTVNDGYYLDSLVITVGGVDVTDTVYGEGYVLVTNVNGDIVITAVASVPQYIEMVEVNNSSRLYTYIDNGTTKLRGDLYSVIGKVSKDATLTDRTVRIVLTNHTESAVSSSNVVIGSIKSTDYLKGGATLHYAISGNRGSIAAGASTTIEYTVKAGYYLSVYMYGSLTCEAVGSLDVYEPVGNLETSSKKTDVLTLYSDDGTLESTGTEYYITVYATTEEFDTDTTIRITALGGGLMVGCVNQALAANMNVYYAKRIGVFDGTNFVFEYTAKAGYRFVYAGFLGNGGNGSADTVYIERA